jgi:AcrR family transcriptional regulator
VSISKPSKPSGGKRAQTRDRLLDVAAGLFEAGGIANVSLDQIAAGAGMTKGAIYGNFSGKDDLVFAVATERTRRVYVAFDDISPVRDQLRVLVRKAFGGTAGRRKHFAFLAELDLYAFSRPDLSQRFVEAARARHARSAAQLECLRDELKLPPLQFAIAVQGVFNGLMFQHACHPTLIDETIAWTALEALLRGSSR